MSLLVKVTASDPASTAYTIVDAAAGPLPQYGPVILGPVDWGNPGWESQPSGPRGSLGRRYVGPDYRDRTVTMTIRWFGSSKDDLLARVDAFQRVLQRVAEWGGVITRRAHQQTWRQHLRVLDVLPQSFTLTRRGELSNRGEMTIGLVCAPFAESDAMDVTDRWATDTTQDYTRDAGAAGNLVVTGGELDAAANLTTENRWVHTTRGHTAPDQQSTMTFRVGATIASFKAGVVVKRTGATTYLEVHVTDNGASSTLFLDKVVAGTRTTLASAGVTRIVAGQTYTVRGRIERNTVYYSLEQTAAPRVTPAGTETSFTLTAGDVTTFGQTVNGYGGFTLNPRDTAAAVLMFEWLPYTYGAATLPDVMRLRGIPGSVDALVGVTIGQINKSWVDFALVGWTPSPGVVNLLDKATTDWTAGSTTSLWGWVTAASLFTNAGGTVARSSPSDAKFGQFHLTATTVAGTTNQGANKVVYGRFRRGVTYTLRVWVRSPASTTTVTVAVGHSSGGSASGTATLSTTWQLVTATWTPTADVSSATIAVYRAASAAADVIHIDGEELYEGQVAPVAASQVSGRGAPAAFGVLEAENTGLAVTSTDTDASGLVTVGATSLLVDANPLAEPGGSALIEVWGRVKFTTTQTSLKARLSWAPYSPYGGAPAGGYSVEHGAAGKPVPSVGVSASYRLVRFGTVQLPALGDESRVLISPALSYATTVTSSTTPVLPTSNSSPYVGATWTNPGNAQADDNVNSTGTASGSWQWSGWSPAVPAGAVLLGIEVTIETTPVTSQGFLTALINHPQLGVLNAANGGYQLVPAGTTVMTFGGPTDLWGTTGWTVADLNAGAFSVQLITITQSTNVDWIKLRAYYTTDVPLIDQVLLVPARRRAVTATGRAPGETRWIPLTNSTMEFVKTVAPDGSAVGGPGRAWVEAAGQSPAAGLGGSLLEFPPGDVDALVKLSGAIPETPQTTYATDDKERVAYVHFAVTPRWGVLRDE